MAEMLEISVGKPVRNIELVGEDGVSVDVDQTPFVRIELEREIQRFNSAFEAMNQAAMQLNELKEQIIHESRDQVISLSMRIAEKILADHIDEKLYNIEKIVEAAIKAAPDKKKLEVHLNPQDASRCQQYIEQDPESSISGVEIVSDMNIEPAQCSVVTNKGIVDYFFEDQLRGIETNMRMSEEV